MAAALPVEQDTQVSPAKEFATPSVPPEAGGEGVEISPPPVTLDPQVAQAGVRAVYTDSAGVPQPQEAPGVSGTQTVTPEETALQKVKVSAPFLGSSESAVWEGVLKRRLAEMEQRALKRKK